MLSREGRLSVRESHWLLRRAGLSENEGFLGGARGADGAFKSTDLEVKCPLKSRYAKYREALTGFP